MPKIVLCTFVGFNYLRIFNSSSCGNLRDYAVSDTKQEQIKNIPYLLFIAKGTQINLSCYFGVFDINKINDLTFTVFSP